MKIEGLREVLAALQGTIGQVLVTENYTCLQALKHTCQAVFCLLEDNSEAERGKMQLEDLLSAYIQLQSSVKAVQISRDKAHLAQKLRTLGAKCEEKGDFSQLQRLYEEVSVQFWLASREFLQPNRPFQCFIYSLLSEKRDNYEGNSQLDPLFDQIAKLQREIRSKDVIIAMCRSEINKLCANLNPILGISLPFIEKYPEIELPRLCQSLFQALSKGKKPARRTYSDWERVEIGEKRGENSNKRMEMQLEEVMFERDLARQQNAILRLGEKDKEMAILGRIQAKESVIRLEIEQIAIEKSYIQREKQAILASKQQLITYKTSEIGVNTALSGGIPKLSASHCLHSSFSARNLSPGAVTKAAEVLEKTHQHLDILERHWNLLSSRKLKDSKKERKWSISLVPETCETEGNGEISTVDEGKTEGNRGEIGKTEGNKADLGKKRSLFGTGRQGSWWSRARSEQTQDRIKAALVA